MSGEQIVAVAAILAEDAGMLLQTISGAKAKAAGVPGSAKRKKTWEARSAENKNRENY